MFGPLVIDIEGYQLTDADKRRIKHPLVGMVILFTRNYQNREQLKSLCDSIHSLKPEILIAVDHEGGRVQRFRDGFTQIPPMASLGELYLESKEAALQKAQAVGFVMASELRACGVDLTFAPCLDVDYSRSTIIGHRAFSSKPEAITALAGSLIDGMRQAGMSNCGKHFPGHGWVKADSHLELPIDERPIEAILESDTVPYRDLGQKLHSVMAAHVLYPQIDAHAAGFSSFWLKTVLREKIQFNGVVFSDDLSMKGAVSQGNVLQRAHAALQAGCDMLIICNDFEATDELLAHLSFTDTQDRERCVNSLKPKGLSPNWEELVNSQPYQLALSLVLD